MRSTENEDIDALASRLAAGDTAALPSTASGEASPPGERNLRLLAAIDSACEALSSSSEPTVRLDSPASAEPQSPGTRWGPLVVLAPIGSGAFGDVYRAWDTVLQREVALKLYRACPSTQSGQLFREAQALAKVKHQNVVTVHNAGFHDGRAGLWMERIDGRSLAGELREGGPFAPREVARIGAAIAHALEAVHAAGLVHRDVKADNVVRDRSGRVVLMDFGIGASLDQLDTDPAGTPPAGTPRYMAPELRRGEAATVRSDLYALGVTLYYLLTQEFPGKRADRVQRAESGAAPPRLRKRRPDVPRPLATLIDALLEPEPSHRPTGAGQVAQDLEVIARSGVRPRAVALVVVGLAIAGGAAWWAAQRAADPLLPQVTARQLKGGQLASVVTSGQVLGPGDQVQFVVEGRAAMYLYIVNRDPRGRLSPLYPVRSSDAAALAPGKPHFIPSAASGWELDAVPGEERFVVVSSTAPLPDLAELFRVFAPAERGVREVPVQVLTREQAEQQLGEALERLRDRSAGTRVDEFVFIKGTKG